MPLTKEQKKQVVENLKEKIDEQKSMVFVAIAGLKADDLLDLRRKLKGEDCSLIVSKKTLLEIALKEKKLDINVKNLEGEVASIFGFGDELSAARIANQFSSQNEALQILGGIFENSFIDKEKVIALAKIPSREELLARMVGSIKAPVSNFVNVLQGNMRGLICVLSAINK